MATLQQVDAHSAVLDDLSTVLIAELVVAWRALGPDDSTARDSLVDLLQELVGEFGTMAQELAIDFYDELREAARLTRPFNATGVDLPTIDRLESLAGWSLQPLTLPEPDPELALSRLSGGLQRVVLDMDRQTIESNSDRDPADARFARHARADACAFCALLATREGDWLYRTEESAERVVTGRGNRRIGETYHDNCHCVAVAVWPDDDLEQPSYVEQWREAYVAALRDGARDLNAILAHMRQSLGLR